MPGYPYHTASSYPRHPGKYHHDAFGHVGDDDRGIRDVCVREIPHSGLDVSSKHPSTNKPLQRTTPVVSPVNGTIVETGNDQHAGLYQIIKHDDYAEWWIGGHHSRFERTSGHVTRGDTTIARMGDTGGAFGVHTHWAVATSLAAARAYIVGWVQYRNGRSVDAWARQAIRGTDQRLYGLLDPWPLIEREWADEVRRLEEVKRQKAAATAAAEAAARLAAGNEDSMIWIRNTGNAGHVYAVGREYIKHETDGKAAALSAKHLSPSGKIIDLTGPQTATILDSLGIPRDAAEKVLDPRGGVWSRGAGVVVDTRTAKV